MVTNTSHETDAERLLREHDGRIRAIVRRYAGPSQDADDLCQECRLACFLAWQAGCPTDLFPSRRAAGAVIDAMRKAGRYGFRDVTGGRRTPRPTSLSQPASPDSDAPLSSSVAAPNRGDASAQAARRESIARALDSLNDDERRILTHQAEDRLTLPAIARLYGRPREWATEAAEAGVAKLARAVALAGGIA